MIPEKDYILMLIKDNGWSIKEFATKAGVSCATVSRWINGKRGAGAELIGGILRVFPEENIKNLFIF